MQASRQHQSLSGHQENLFSLYHYVDFFLISFIQLTIQSHLAQNVFLNILILSFHLFSRKSLNVFGLKTLKENAQNRLSI